MRYIPTKNILRVFVTFILLSTEVFAQRAVDSTRNKPVWLVEKTKTRPTQTLKNDILHTRLDLRFDWLRQHLLGSAQIRFKPYFYPQNTLELDAKGFDIKGVFQLDTLERLDTTTKQYIKELVFDTLEYTYNKKRLVIKLRKNHSRFDTLNVLIDYIAKPNEGRYQRTGAYGGHYYNEFFWR
jgi:aminopeptidase N